MPKQTSSSYLTSITRRISTCARHKDLKRLESYLQTDDFVRTLAALNPEHRLAAAVAIAKAFAACRALIDQTQPLPSQGSMRIRWKGNDELIAKVRRLAPLYPRDEDFARQLGIPLHAARVARHRYVGRKSIGAAAT